MSTKLTCYVLFDDVIVFLRKHLRAQVCFDNDHCTDRFDDFFEVLGYDDPTTSLKQFAFDFAWMFPKPELIEKLELALEVLIQDPFSNFIIHNSPSEHKWYVPMSRWEGDMLAKIGG